MAKNTSRCGRLGDLMQREISRLIRDDFSDPRYGMITVSAVLVTEDLSYARVFVTVLNDSQQISSLAELNDAVGYFRTQVAKKLSTRIVPKIRFFYDDSLVEGAKMDRLLNSISTKDQNESTSD